METKVINNSCILTPSQADHKKLRPKKDRLSGSQNENLKITYFCHQKNFKTTHPNYRKDRLTSCGRGNTFGNDNKK